MPSKVSGVFKFTKKKAGVLRDPAFSFRKRPGEVLVPAALVREYHLVEGASITGVTRPGRSGPLLASVESISGLTPEAFHARRPYTTLTAIDPCERFHLAASGVPSMRIVDMVAPIGKGSNITLELFVKRFVNASNKAKIAYIEKQKEYGIKPRSIKVNGEWKFFDVKNNKDWTI